ncbi:hypothetical protein [Acidocella sp. MX-AZ03]|uniref:hypothetical protein n=1 Tax=Acidocella sp. MX-AZ03 TaxID=2697363 RepID=UPI003FA44D89
MALRADFATAEPARLEALLGVLLHAQRLCAAPDGRQALSQLLARPEYLDLPAPLLLAALDPAQGGPAFTAPYPAPAYGQWYARQMQLWGRAPAGLEGWPRGSTARICFCAPVARRATSRNRLRMPILIKKSADRIFYHHDLLK